MSVNPVPHAPATDEEVAKMVERLHTMSFHICIEAADLLARVARERDAHHREYLRVWQERGAQRRRAKAAEQERDEAQLVARYETDVAAAEIEGRKAAEARLAEVEKERDEARELSWSAATELGTVSARLAKAKEALRDIVWFDWSDNDDDAVAAIDRARAALAAMEAGDGK